MKPELSSEAQESLAKSTARIVRNSGALVMGTDFSLARYDVRRDASSHLDLYYTGEEPSRAEADMFKKEMKPFKKIGIHVSLTKSPLLLYDPPMLHGSSEVNPTAAVHHLSLEDAIGIKLGRASCRAPGTKRTPRSGLPDADEYYDIYQVFDRVGFRWLDSMMALNLHSTDLDNLKLNLLRLRSSLFASEFADFATAEGFPSFRDSLTALQTEPFAVTRFAIAHAKACDEGRADPQALQKTRFLMGGQSGLGPFPAMSSGQHSQITPEDFSRTRENWRPSDFARMTASLLVRDALASTDFPQPDPATTAGTCSTGD